jgi:DUF4097 and DUF4098 domain-containing protein YvlB
MAQHSKRHRKYIGNGEKELRKQEFIQELQRGLASAPPHIREEIVADINAHFSEAISQGMSEEDICRNLGQPGTIAAQVLEEYGENGANHPPQGTLESVMEGIGGVVEGFAEAFKGFGQIFNEPGQSGNASEEEIDIDKTFTGVRNIKIKMTDAKIELKPSGDGTCRITLRGRMRNNGFNVHEEDGTLSVSDNPVRHIFGFMRFKTNLVVTVYVPHQFDGDIKVRSSLGNISANDIGGCLNLKTAAGNVSVENHGGKKIKISTAAGNATAHLMNRCVESIAISTAAGNAKITAEETGELTLNSAAGNVDATITRLLGDARISTAAGSANVTFHEVMGNIDVSTAAGSAKINLPYNVNCRIEARKPAIGSLHNELAGNPHSPYVLRASTSVGSIKIKAI